MVGTSQIGARTRVAAHRGFHAPTGPVENTLGAFRRALDAGADVLELDIRLTRDRIPVVHHDAKLAGTSTKLANLDASQLPALADGQSIPTLDEVVDLARAAGARLDVELKEHGYEQIVIDALRRGLPTDRFEVISFVPKAVRAVKAIDPQIRTGLLAPRIPGTIRESWLYPAALGVVEYLGLSPSLARATRLGADYVSVDRRMATPRFLADAARRGIPVDSWTVNDPVEMRRLFEARIQSVVTDDTATAVSIRAQVQGTAAPDELRISA